MVPSQSFGSCRVGGGGAENGRRPGEGQTPADKGQTERQAAAAERSMRVSHIDVTMLNSSPTASCEFRRTSACLKIASN